MFSLFRAPLFQNISKWQDAVNVDATISEQPQYSTDQLLEWSAFMGSNPTPE